jgi:ferredoxin-fold anticodon binding domain-containing protein
LKHYRRFKNIYLSTQEIDINEEVQDEEDDEKILKVIEILRHMKKECIEIIDLRFGLFTENQITEGSVVNKRFIEIAKILNLEYANVRQRFIRCIQALLAKYRKKETALYN